VAERWNLIIHNADKFWIIREEGTSSEYVLMKKPIGLFGNGHPIEYYKAANKEEAIDKGLKIAEKHGLL